MGGKEKTQNSEEQNQLKSRPLLRMRMREQELFCTLFHKKYKKMC